MTAESWNSRKNRRGKHVTAATDARATVEKPLKRGVFYAVRTEVT
jgi:hypothetical protein